MDTSVRGRDENPSRDHDPLALLGGSQASFLRSVLDASADCIKIIELDGTVSYMNENGRCAMEIDDFCQVDGADWASLWPDESRHHVVRAVASARNGEPRRFEAFCPTAKGAPRWWDVSVAPVPGADGRPERFVSISRDVTERVEHTRAIEAHERELERLTLSQAATLQEKGELLRQKDLLMREVDHRVKNSLALVTSLLNVQSRTAEGDQVRRALSRAAQRVSLIASVHERLYKGREIGRLEASSYLTELCDDLEQSLGEGHGVTVTVSCKAVEVDADQATIMGLIVSELVTNAIRHAFDEGEGGVVRVSLAPNEDGVSCLTVEDDGRGLPEGFDPNAGRGLGMRVVTSYARQHGWTLDVTSDGGARFCVQMTD